MNKSRKSETIDARVRGRLRFRHMALLAALGEHRSLRKAAQVMHLAQPTAGKLLRELEAVFDLPLFERTKRGVSPTPYGEILVRRANAVLSDLDGAREELASLAEGAVGRVRVGVFSVNVPQPLVETILSLRQSSPNLMVTVRQAGSDSLLPALGRGELDCVLGRIGASERHAGLDGIPLYREALHLVVGNQHPLLRRKSIKLSDLVGEQWIFPPKDALLRASIESAFEMHGLNIPAHVIESDSMALNEALLQKSDFVCAFPESLARYHADKGALSVLSTNFVRKLSPVGVWIRKGARHETPLSRFLDTLKNAAAGNS